MRSVRITDGAAMARTGGLSAAERAWPSWLSPARPGGAGQGKGYHAACDAADWIRHQKLADLNHALGSLLAQNRADFLRAYFHGLVSGSFKSEQGKTRFEELFALSEGFQYCAVLAVGPQAPEGIGLPPAELGPWMEETMGKNGYSCCAFPWGTGLEVVIVGDIHPVVPESVLPAARSLLDGLNRRFGAACVAGIGRAGRLEGLMEQFRQACAALDYSYFDSSSEAILYSKRCEPHAGEELNLDVCRERLIGALQAMDCTGLRGAFDEVLANFHHARPSRAKASGFCIGLYYSLLSMAGDREILKGDLFPELGDVSEALIRMNSAAEFTAWLQRLRDRLCAALDQKNDSRSSRQIALIKDYIQEHCGEKLTLSSVAQVMNISRGYLSSIFKKETGIHFSDYIAQVKVEKAKRLILEHKYLMYEISDMLGFENPYYFSKVFKKLAGCSPREYSLQALSEELSPASMELEGRTNLAAAAG